MISIPTMITTMGHMCSHMGLPISQANPKMTIMMPKIMPIIAPPWGRPKHSSSKRFSVFGPKHSSSLCLATRLGAYRDAPQLTHISASSSFLAPHLVQYTMGVSTPVDIFIDGVCS